MTNDQRTDDQKEQTEFFVCCEDTFLGGWGEAPDKSYFCVGCDSAARAHEFREILKQRDEFKRVGVAKTPRTGGEGCHTSICWHGTFTWRPGQ